MKPLYRILLTAVCLPFLFAACSLTSLIREESRLEQVRVYLADGSIIEGKAKLPDLEDRHIRIASNGKGHRCIKADSIKALAFRRENSEGRRDIFLYSKYRNRDRVTGPFWMKLEGYGPHLDICRCGAYYAYGKDGEVEVQSSFNDRVYIVAFRKDCPGQLVGYDDSRIATLRMNLLEILGDDPVLCAKLQGRELSVSDYRTICSEYNPENSREDGKFI